MFLTSFSELNLLRGERHEQEKRRWDKNYKESTEEDFQGKPMEVLLTGDLHSEDIGHLPSAYQPTVLARVRKDYDYSTALGLFEIDKDPPRGGLSLSVRVILKALQTDSRIPPPSKIRTFIIILKLLSITQNSNFAL